MLGHVTSFLLVLLRLLCFLGALVMMQVWVPACRVLLGPLLSFLFVILFVFLVCCCCTAGGGVTFLGAVSCRGVPSVTVCCCMSQCTVSCRAVSLPCRVVAVPLLLCRVVLVLLCRVFFVVS